MNRYLILVKHSIPEILERIPAREWHLSGEGRLRAEQLAERLRAYQPDILISSAEPKARETAQIIANLHSLDVQVVEDLHEHDRRHTPYLGKQQFERSVDEFFLNPATLVFGSETADEAHQRFARAVHRVLETHREKTIVIVSHGTVISLFVSRLTDVVGYDLWKELGLPSFVVLDMQSNTFILQENIS